MNDEQGSTGARPRVSVVDDDESVRESLPDLLEMFGFEAQPFSSATQFLASSFIDRTECLILDMAMPGMSGPDLQRELVRRGHDLPIVFITAQDADALRARGLELGTGECLHKPFSDTALLAAIHTALRARTSRGIE